MNLTVDVISDVICPWCYIGKRRLEQAIAAYGRLVRVRWLPFQLNPSMPKAGISRREYRTQKFGSWERSQQLDAQVAAAGEAEGLNFAFDRIERTPNTRDAHWLIELAGRNDVQDTVVEALFSAYFREGRDIGNPQTLLDVTSDAGLDRAQAEAMLNSSESLKAIREAEEWSRQYGVGGVPFFIIHGKIGLSGAQPPEVFLEAFSQEGGPQ